MKLITCMFLLACAANRIASQDENQFRCYECIGEQCNDLTDDLLKYCGPETATTTTDSTIGTTNTITSETESDSTTPSETTDSTETSTLGSTDSSSTPTTVSSSSVTPESSSPATTASSSVVSTESSSPATTASSPVVSTESSSPETTESVETTETVSSNLIQELPQEESNFEVATSGNGAQNINNIARAQETLRSQLSPAAVLIRNYRSIQRTGRADGTAYGCYSVQVKDGDSSQNRRGCIAIPEDKSACEAVEAELGQSIEDCSTCFQTGCNGVGAIQISCLTLLAALIIKWFM